MRETRAPDAVDCRAAPPPERRRSPRSGNRMTLGILLVLASTGIIAPTADGATGFASQEAPQAGPAHRPPTSRRPSRRASSPTASRARSTATCRTGRSTRRTDAYLRYDLLTDIALFSVGLTASGRSHQTATGYAEITGPQRHHRPARPCDRRPGRPDGDLVRPRQERRLLREDPAPWRPRAASSAAFVARQGPRRRVPRRRVCSPTSDFAAYGAFVGQVRAALRASNPAARVSVATNGSHLGRQAWPSRPSPTVPIGSSSWATATGRPARAPPGASTRSSGRTAARASPGRSTCTRRMQRPGEPDPARPPLLRTLVEHDVRGPARHDDELGRPFIPGTDLAAVPAGHRSSTDPVEGSKWFASRTPSRAVDGDLCRRPGDARGQVRLGRRAWARRHRHLGARATTRAARTTGTPSSGAFGTVRRAGRGPLSAPPRRSAADAFEPGVAVAYVATGASFPDALAAAAAAGRRRRLPSCCRRRRDPGRHACRAQAAPACADRRRRRDRRRSPMRSWRSSPPWRRAVRNRAAGADRYGSAAPSRPRHSRAGRRLPTSRPGRISPTRSLRPRPRHAMAGRSSSPARRPAGRNPAPSSSASPRRGLSSSVGPRAVSRPRSRRRSPPLPGAVVSRSRARTARDLRGGRGHVRAGCAASSMPRRALPSPTPLRPRRRREPRVRRLLTRPDLAASRDPDQIVRLEPTRAVVAGGTAVVSDAVLVAVRSAVAAP